TGIVPVTELPSTLPIWPLVTQFTQARLKLSAEPALRLLIANGFETTCCRGVSGVNDPPPVERTVISRKRFEPLKQAGQGTQVPPAKKWSCTVKIPFTTATLVSVIVEPC